MTTEELMNALAATSDIEAFLAENEAELLQSSVRDLLLGYQARKKCSVAEIAKKSGQGDYVYKVFSGKRTPSRDILLCVAIGMELCLEEAQLLLRIAKMARLDPRIRRDSIIIYAINNNTFIEKVNEILYDLGEEPL